MSTPEIVGVHGVMQGRRTPYSSAAPAVVIVGDVSGDAPWRTFADQLLDGVLAEGIPTGLLDIHEALANPALLTRAASVGTKAPLVHICHREALAVAGQLGAAPFIVSAHGPDPVAGLSTTERHWLAAARLVVCDSAAGRAALLSQTDRTPDAVAVVRPTIAPEFRAVPGQPASHRLTWWLHHRRPFVAVLREDHSVADRAFLARMWQRVPEPMRRTADLLVVRSGLASGERGSVTQHFSNGAPVEFPGATVAERAALLASAAIAVVSDQTRWGSVALLEALACGTRVVAARGGVLEEFGGPATSYVDTEDEVGLAAQLAAILRESPGERTRLTREGLTRAAHFSAPAVVRQYAELYLRVRGPLQHRIR